MKYSFAYQAVGGLEPGGFIFGLKTGRGAAGFSVVVSADGAAGGGAVAMTAAFAFCCSSSNLFFSSISAGVISANA